MSKKYTLYIFLLLSYAVSYTRTTTPPAPVSIDIMPKICHTPLQETEIKLPNPFVKWHCTRYVASRKHITRRGNWGEWLRNAKQKWIETGWLPRIWAIVVMNSYSLYKWYWHVAIVKDFNIDGYITIEEMNFKWLWVVSTRKIKVDSPTITWYIYF